jgi:hypothetical protein
MVGVRLGSGVGVKALAWVGDGMTWIESDGGWVIGGGWFGVTGRFTSGSTNPTDGPSSILLEQAVKATARKRKRYQ